MDTANLTGQIAVNKSNAAKFLATEIGDHFYTTASVTTEGFALIVRDPFIYQGRRIEKDTYVQFDSDGNPIDL